MSKTGIKTKTVSVCAVMCALAVVLSFVKIFSFPLGGSVTLFSTLPLFLLSYFYGVKKSLLPCLIYAGIQFFIDGAIGWGLTPTVLVGCVIFDYIIAFCIPSISCLLFKNKRFGFLYGVIISMLVRFISHFLSGVIFFANFDVFGSPFVYSLVYNGAFMGGELIITALGAFLLCIRKETLERIRGIACE